MVPLKDNDDYARTVRWREHVAAAMLEDLKRGNHIKARERFELLAAIWDLTQDYERKMESEDI